MLNNIRLNKSMPVDVIKIDLVLLLHLTLTGVFPRQDNAHGFVENENCSLSHGLSGCLVLKFTSS